MLVLAVFLISLVTDGYVYGILASLLSVLIDNFVFAFPYFAFDFINSINLISAVVMLIVAIITCTLTTKLKMQEKLRAEGEMERMRANLLRAISHDLRTPLTTIYGSSSTILENYDSIRKEQQIKLLGEIREDSESLIRMVENLLSVTRIGEGIVKLEKVPTVLEELIDTLLVKFHKHYPDARVQVTIPEEFISIPMDPVLIEQVLMNLLENAVFHAHGMRSLWLRVEVKHKHAVFCVEDDGCGISEERMAHLFTGLLDSKAPADSNRNNMGIGLSVCRTIIRAHGSELKAGNRPEGGAAFRFSLEMEENDYGE